MADVTICVAFQRVGGYLLRQNTGLPKVVCVTSIQVTHLTPRHLVIAGKNGSDLPGYKNISGISGLVLL